MWTVNTGSGGLEFSHAHFFKLPALVMLVQFAKCLSSKRICWCTGLHFLKHGRSSLCLWRTLTNQQRAASSTRIYLIWAHLASAHRFETQNVQAKIGWCPLMGYPNKWLVYEVIMENPIKIDDLGIPPFLGKPHILCWERPGFFLLFALVLDVIAESSIEARCLCRWHKAPALWRNDNVEASLSAPSVGLELSQLRFCTSQIKSSVHVPKENKENKILKIAEIC